MARNLKSLALVLIAALAVSASFTSAAMAEPEFKTGSDETVVTSSAHSALIAHYLEYEVECNNLTSATVVGTSQPEVTAENVAIDGCVIRNGETELTVDTPFNDCDAIITGGEEVEKGHRFAGEVQFECAPEPVGIEANVTFLGFKIPCIKIPPQVPTSTTIEGTNEGEGETMRVLGSASVKGIEYTVLNSICGEPGTYNDGELEGELTITGEDVEGEHIPVTIE